MMPDYSVSREMNDLGFLTFDLKADLNPIFNWNVKQLFLYLTAEYVTDKNVSTPSLTVLILVFECLLMHFKI